MVKEDFSKEQEELKPGDKNVQVTQIDEQEYLKMDKQMYNHDILSPLSSCNETARSP